MLAVWRMINEVALRYGIVNTIWYGRQHIGIRYQVLDGGVGLRCRDLLRKIAVSKEMIIYADSIIRDHMPMLIGIPPQLSVSRPVQYPKGKVFIGN